MRKATCLLGALGLVTLTAGCVQESQYPTTAYNPGYTTAYSPGYATGYGSRPVYTTGSNNRGWNSTNRDYDRDGIPNRYDRDANGDSVPDRYQGRR
jgi:hypothetical protein